MQQAGENLKSRSVSRRGLLMFQLFARPSQSYSQNFLRFVVGKSKKNDLTQDLRKVSIMLIFETS